MRPQHFAADHTGVFNCNLVRTRSFNEAAAFCCGSRLRLSLLLSQQKLRSARAVVDTEAAHVKGPSR